VRGLVELQWHTGARPGELLRLRPADVDTRGDVWTVDLGHGHKTGHRGKQRIIYLGPQAQAVLRPFLLRPSDATCFDPREAVREALAKPGNPNTKGRRPKPRQSDRVIQDAYTTASYRRAIARACVKAGIEAWHPHQLRHAAATRFREAYGLEAAQALLGHATLQATQVYAERTHAAAIEAARGM
jgi:integrase